MARRPSGADAARSNLEANGQSEGSSISDVHTGFVSAGTLGCFVVRRQSPYYVGMLTNNHVIDNVRVEYDMGVLRFDNQIEIEGTGKRAFSDSGDSGSLIVDEDRKAIGLLFAGGDVGGSNGMGLTYANPIETVLDALKVDLEL